jgi:hypothetical protein
MKNNRHSIKYLVPENDREKPVAALAGAVWSWLEAERTGWLGCAGMAPPPKTAFPAIK